MLKSKIVSILVSGLLAAMLFGSTPLLAETPPQKPPEAMEKEVKYILTLKAMMEEIKSLRGQVVQKEKALKRATLQMDKAALTEEVRKSGARLKILKKDFEQIATGTDLSAFDAKPQKAFDWQEEVLELLKPVVQEMKKMTARPRQIEALRNEIDYYGARLPIVRKATDNLRTLIAQTRDKRLKREFKSLKKVWDSREKQINSQMTSARLKLEELSREKKSFLESAQAIFQVFFKSRGKNLLFALFCSLSVFFMLRLIHRVIYKYSPIHRERPVYIRIFDAFYHLVTGLGAAFAFLMILYIRGDWVLMTLAVIFLLGFLWAAKKNLLQFWNEIKILLNLGSVRENERMIYQGIPWKVVSLNIYSELENPALKSRIRLPLKEFMNLTSYPYHPDEPWFPCREGEWVILADGTRGEVLSQTHEMVRLGLRGGAYKTYQTDGFLGLSPMNISDNFRLKVTFGVDYKHQAESTREIPEKLGALLTQKLKSHGFAEGLLALRVDFKSAAASSLDFEIIADYEGIAAPLYSRIQREIQRFAVEACTENGWEIPFTQITLHQAGSQ